MPRMAKASEWSKRIEAWRESGKSASEFCKGRDYSSKSLQWWSWHLDRSGASTSTISRRVALARVVRTPGPVDAIGASTIVVHVGVARVEVSTAVDRAALATVLDVLLTSSAGALR
jgi:hypothetical protein